MTDRELLEKAAKAAGMQIEGDADKLVVFPGHFGGGFSVFNDRGGSQLWNPLTDDGDALRLAVKLHIDICWNQNHGPWEVNAWPSDGSMGSGEGPEDDPYAATRRAIVRIAARSGLARGGRTIRAATEQMAEPTGARVATRGRPAKTQVGSSMTEGAEAVSIDIDAMEAAARAATPGPWVHRRDGLPELNNQCEIVESADSADSLIVYQKMHNINDAAHIAAANPGAVLALIAVARAAREALSALECALQNDVRDCADAAVDLREALKGVKL